MEKIICKICGKRLEGYGKGHVEYLLKQHMLKHDKELKENLKGGKNV